MFDGDFLFQLVILLATEGGRAGLVHYERNETHKNIFHAGWHLVRASTHVLDEFSCETRSYMNDIIWPLVQNAPFLTPGTPNGNTEPERGGHLGEDRLRELSLCSPERAR